MPKEVYLVRHGETEMNALDIHQKSDSALSSRGLKQAQLLAKRFSSIQIDKIFSSPFPRALQTAETINEVARRPLVTSPLLQEGKRPTEIEGKHKEDPDVEKIKELIFQNIHDPEWRFSDEENYHDFQKRIAEFLVELEAEQSEAILVVSHEVVIKTLAMLMLFGERADHNMFLLFYRKFKMMNTGITVFEEKSHGWRLLTWNDYAHLGE